MIKTGSALSVTRQAELLSVSRSSVYYRPPLDSQEELDLLKRLDEIFTENPMYGSRRLPQMLKREGTLVGRRRIRRLMKKLGLWAIGPKPNTSKPHPEHKIKISMDGRGRCHDNIFVERLWWTVKHEWVYQRLCDDGIEQRKSLAECFDWYNRRRPHQSLGWRTPDETHSGRNLLRRLGASAIPGGVPCEKDDALWICGQPAAPVPA